MLRAGHVLILCVTALLTLGVVMVNSASLDVTADEGISLAQVLTSRPLIYAAVAGFMLIAGAFFPLRHLYQARGVRSPVPWLIVAIFVLLVLAHVPGISMERNGASRWISIAGISFQPSEFAKWAILIVLACHGARNAASMHRVIAGLLPAIWLVGLICAVIAVEDLGTAVLIGVVSTIVLLCAGVRVWQAAIVLPVAAAAFIGFVIQSPYRVTRLMSYLNPFEDPRDSGYQIIQSMAAISGGDLAGRGLGGGVRKFGYLPEDTTDFIFAVICEELGVFGAAFVVFLYGGVLVAGLMVIRKMAHPFYRLLAAGVILTVGLQAMINMAVVTGIAPTKGIALPLLSHGGTGWALTAFSIGLLVAMERENRSGLMLRDPASVST